MLRVEGIVSSNLCQHTPLQVDVNTSISERQSVLKIPFKDLKGGNPTLSPGKY